MESRTTRGRSPFLWGENDGSSWFRNDNPETLKLNAFLRFCLSTYVLLKNQDTVHTSVRIFGKMDNFNFL